MVETNDGQWVRFEDYGKVAAEVDRLRVVAPQQEQALDAETEQRLREYLWLSHGHRGVYGDDDEMQCGECAPMWDYRRSPLTDVIRQAIKARREVNIAALRAAAVDPPPDKEP